MGSPAGRRGLASLTGLAALVALTAGAPFAAFPALVPAREPGVPALGGKRDTLTRVDRPDTLSRDELLRLWARSFHPARSGDILLVPRRGDMLTVPGIDNRYMHGTPWDYDARVPMVLVGDGRIRGGIYRTPASHEDLGATLAALLGAPSAASGGEAGGRILVEAVARRHAAGAKGERGSDPTAPGPPSPPPDSTSLRLLALLVLDGMRADYLERYADSVPRLRDLIRRGASFPEARMAYLPTATAVAHATLSTGVTPRLHGIVANDLVPLGRKGGRNAFEGGSPRQLLARTLADRWAALTHGRALVAVQGGTDYPAAALAGQGACVVGGWRHHVAFFRSRTGRWGTHEPCYRLLPSLDSLDVASLWPTGVPTWKGRRPDGPRELRTTGLFARLEGRAVLRTLRSLPMGRDSVTDLLLVNLKTLDYVGHRFGPDSPEIAAALAAVDREMGDLLDELDRAAGPEGWVLALTSDHGMAGEPPPGRNRHFLGRAVERLDRRFDPGGPGIVRFLSASGLQLYLDRQRLATLGLTVEEVARHVASWPWIRAAFSHRELLAAQTGRGLGRRLEP